VPPIRISFLSKFSAITVSTGSRALRIGLEAGAVDDRELRREAVQLLRSGRRSRWRMNRLCQASSVTTRTSSAMRRVGAADTGPARNSRAPSCAPACRHAAVEGLGRHRRVVVPPDVSVDRGVRTTNLSLGERPHSQILNHFGFLFLSGVGWVQIVPDHRGANFKKQQTFRRILNEIKVLIDLKKTAPNSIGSIAR
jgi:hypothetical protein